MDLMNEPKKWENKEFYLAPTWVLKIIVHLQGFVYDLKVTKLCCIK